MIFKIIESGDLNLLKEYLSYDTPLKVNIKMDENTPLTYAIEKNNEQLVKILLEKKADPDLNTPLYKIITSELPEEQKIRYIDFLIEYDVKTNTKIPLVELAIENKNIKVLNHLFKIGVKRKGRFGEPLIWLTLKNTGTEILEYLLNEKKQKSIKMKHDIPLFKNDISIFEYLLQYNQSQQSIINKLSILIKYGLDINKVTKEGDNILHILLKYSDVKDLINLVDLLAFLTRDTKLNLANNSRDGKSPIELLEEKNIKNKFHFNIIKNLIV